MKIKISVYSNVKICLSSKFGWNRPSNFGWDIENVKRLQTGRQTTNKMWSKNITWTFSSGQLKCHFQHKMTRKTKMKFLKPYCAYIGLQKSYSKKWFVYCWKCKRSSENHVFMWRTSWFTSKLSSRLAEVYEMIWFMKGILMN